MSEFLSDLLESVLGWLLYFVAEGLGFALVAGVILGAAYLLYRLMGGSLTKTFTFNLTSGGRLRPRSSFSGPSSMVTVQHAEPMVLRLDEQTLSEAKKLFAAGATLDVVCRKVSPQYDDWGAFEQAAFRSVLEAALTHPGTTEPPVTEPRP